MKKRKIVYLFPLAALLLSGCSFKEIKHSIGESWVGEHLLHPIYDPIRDFVNNKKDDGGNQQGGNQQGGNQEDGGGEEQKVVAKSIKELIGLPEKIEQGEVLAASSLEAIVVYSDNSEKQEKVTNVELDTSEVGEAPGKAYVNSLSYEFSINVVAKEVPPVGDTITPQEAISLMEQAGEGKVVEGLKKVKGICASGTKYDSKYKQYTTGFEGVENFKVQFTDTNNILNGGSPDGMEIVVEGYLEKYQEKYQLSYLPVSASPTGEKFTPNLVSAQAVIHEGALERITVSESHREFYKGATFVEETVTAHYSDGATATVKGTFTGYDMDTLGEQTVTVSYSEKGVTKETTYTISVIEKVPVVGGSVYTFKNDKTQAQNMKDWTSEQFMAHVEVDGGEIITGMKDATNAYIGGNGGSGDTQWNIWNCLKVGKSSAKGSISLTLDPTATFSKIKMDVIGARDDGTLTVNGITKDVTKKAVIGDLEPISIEFEIAENTGSLLLESKDASSNNYGICITKIEFVNGFVPAPVPKLDSLELSKSPNKVDYYVGDEFDPTGMEITAKYTNDGQDKILETADYSIDKTVLSLEDTFVTVSYTEDGITKTVDVPVTVTKAPVPVTGISLNKTEVSMKVNEEDIILAATVAPEDADDPTVVWSVSKEGVVTVNNGVVHAVAAGEVTVTATAGDFHADCVVTVAPADKILSEIEVTTPPNKTSYVAGEIFDPTGMVVTASYSSGHDSEEVTGYTYSTAALEETDTTVEIDYNGQKAYVTISVSPAPVLDSITVANAQGKTAEYTVGDVISKDDIVVTAHYTQGKPDAVVTNYTISKTTALALGDTSVTITYVEGGVEKTCAYSFTVVQANLIETMTSESLGLTGSYESFSVVSKETGVLFEGNAMKSSGGYIQMRDTAQGSGIYSRTSARYLKSIAFEFDSANGKTISVYGLNGAYKDISSTTEGALLGSVTSDGKITAEDNYLNFCIVSTGATYIKSITVEWSGAQVAKSVESVTLNKTAADVGLDSTLQLSAIVDGVGASQNVVWETSDAAKATVENGLVTPVAGGEVTITAKSADDNSVKAECVVTVTAEKTLMATDFATTESRPSHSNYADTWSFGDFTITNGANNNAGWDYIKLGKKSTTQTCTVDAPAAPAEVKKVIVAIHAGSLSKTKMSVTEWGVEVFSDSEMTTSIDKVVSSTAITKNADEVTFTPSAGKTWAKGCFIRVYFKTVETGGGNGVVCLTGITYIG